MKKKIPGVYKITNTVTGDFYIGSSNDVYRRFGEHKKPSVWKAEPKKLYQDMQKYGLDKFKFEVIVSIMPEVLKGVEQDCIELMKPTYNHNRADGPDVERRKASQKAYRQSEKGKAWHKAYHNQLCNYNGEILTLNALAARFSRAGIPHPSIEAKKYLI